MDMIMMEKSDFDRLSGQIEEILRYIRKQKEVTNSDGTDRWLSNQEAMDILGVSARTLQRYRSIGRITFSMIGKKCRYRLSDLDQALQKYRVNRSETNPDELRRQYLARMGQMPEIPKKT